jgi:hypothetical protein
MFINYVQCLNMLYGYNKIYKILLIFTTSDAISWILISVPTVNQIRRGHQNFPILNYSNIIPLLTINMYRCIFNLTSKVSEIICPSISLYTNLTWKFSWVFYLIMSCKNIWTMRKSVNRSRMNIKCKTCDNRTGINIYFSTQKSFDYCLSNFCTWSGIICDFRTSLREFLDPIVNYFKWQKFPTVNRWISFALSPFAYKKSTTEHCSSIVHSSSTVVILTAETSLWTCACASAT